MSNPQSQLPQVSAVFISTWIVATLILKWHILIQGPSLGGIWWGEVILLGFLLCALFYSLWARRRRGKRDRN